MAGKFQIRSPKWDIGILVGSIAVLLFGFGGLFLLHGQAHGGAGGKTQGFVIFMGVLTFLFFSGPGIVYVLRKRVNALKNRLPGGTMTWIRSHLYLPVVALISAYAHASVVPFRANLSSGKVLIVLGLLVSIAGLARHHLIGIQKAALNVDVAIGKMATGQPRRFRRLVADYTDNKRSVAEIDADMATLPAEQQQVWAQIKATSAEVEKHFPRGGGQRWHVRQYKLFRALHPPLTIALFLVLAFHVWDVLGGTRAVLASDAESIPAAQECAGCHSAIFDEWSGSTMSHAQTSTINEAQLPITLSENARLIDQFDPADGRDTTAFEILTGRNLDDDPQVELVTDNAHVCIDCHAPVGGSFADDPLALLPFGDSVASLGDAVGITAGDGDAAALSDGVGCVVCHSSAAPPAEREGNGSQEGVNSLVANSDAHLGGFSTVYGPLFANPNPLPVRIHGIETNDDGSDYWLDDVETSQLCGACHNVKLDIDGDGITGVPGAEESGIVDIISRIAAGDDLDADGDFQLDENELDDNREQSDNDHDGQPDGNLVKGLGQRQLNIDVNGDGAVDENDTVLAFIDLTGPDDEPDGVADGIVDNDGDTIPDGLVIDDGSGPQAATDPPDVLIDTDGDGVFDDFTDKNGNGNFDDGTQVVNGEDGQLDDLVLQTTFDEWQDYVAFFDRPGGFTDRYSDYQATVTDAEGDRSDAGAELDNPLGCNSCHMPLEEDPSGAVVDYAPGLLSIPNRSGLDDAPDGFRASHTFVGVDYDLDPELYHRSGLSDDDIAQVVAERDALVASAATVQVQLGDAFDAGFAQALPVDVTVRNNLLAHSFPTGFAFARQFWLEVSAETRDGQPVCLLPAFVDGDPFAGDVNPVGATPCASGVDGVSSDRIDPSIEGDAELRQCDTRAFSDLAASLPDGAFFSNDVTATNADFPNLDIQWAPDGSFGPDDCDPWLANFQKILTDGDPDLNGIRSEVPYQPLLPNAVKIRGRLVNSQVMAELQPVRVRDNDGDGVNDPSDSIVLPYVFDVSDVDPSDVIVTARLRFRHLPPYFVRDLEARQQALGDDKVPEGARIDADELLTHMHVADLVTATSDEDGPQLGCAGPQNKADDTVFSCVSQSLVDQVRDDLGLGGGGGGGGDDRQPIDPDDQQGYVPIEVLRRFGQS